MEFADFANAPYETGTRRGAMQIVTLHIFGRNRGERDDLAGYIRLALTDYCGLVIFNWADPANPVVKYTTSIEDIDVQNNSIGPELAMEGVLTNWSSISFDFQLRE
jgi:hypothetical protein